jgi:ferritin-like metal-binding protein YciE
MENIHDSSSPLMTIPSLKVFILEHLNRIYSAKSHLSERLPELLDQTSFMDIRELIVQAMTDVNKQLTRMDRIYELLEVEHHVEISKGMVGTMEDAFSLIYKTNFNSLLRDLSVLYYLQNIEAIEMGSFQVLDAAALQLPDRRASQLIRESYEEAKAVRALSLHLTVKYLSD